MPLGYLVVLMKNSRQGLVKYVINNEMPRVYPK
jgi:hypothetical protein